MPRGINRRLPIDLTPNLIARFHDGVCVSGPDECWPWQRCIRNGYGAIKHHGKVIGAHRVAYVIANGEPEDGHIVRHTCDNKICCNPSHLVEGTPADNVHDMHERGQARVLQGALRPNSVLTEPLVRAIRLIRETLGYTHRRIAAELGLEAHVDAVKGVVEGKSWKHL